MFLQQMETVIPEEPEKINETAPEEPVDMQENFLEFRFRIVILIILHIS